MLILIQLLSDCKEFLSNWNDIYNNYSCSASFCFQKGAFLLQKLERSENMDKRIAVVGIILEGNDIAEEVNNVLHSYSDIIVGRMGLPYKERNCSVISIIVDADTDKISALTGRLGKIQGISVKAAISKG